MLFGLWLLVPPLLMRLDYLSPVKLITQRLAKLIDEKAVNQDVIGTSCLILTIPLTLLIRGGYFLFISWTAAFFFFCLSLSFFNVIFGRKQSPKFRKQSKS